jgi:hypothetical protein
VYYVKKILTKGLSEDEARGLGGDNTRQKKQAGKATGLSLNPDPDPQ